MADDRRFSLRFTIATLIGVLLLSTVAGVLFIGYLIRVRVITATAETLQGEISTRITERVVERFAPTTGMLRALAAAADGGRLSSTDDAVLEHLVDRMRFEDRLEWLAWIRPDGTGVGAIQHPDGLMAVRIAADNQAAIEIRSDDGTRTAAPSRDLSSLQQAPWFELATGTDGPIWTEPYIRPFDGQPGSACAIAVRRDGQVIGVFGLGFGMQFMRTYLDSIEVGRTGAVLTVDRKTGEVANAPSEEALRRLGPAVDAAVATLPGGVTDLQPGVLQSIPVKSGGVHYRVGLSLQQPAGLPRWIHAIVVPDEELVGYFGGYLMTGLLAVAGLLLLALLLTHVLSHRVARSLDAIAQDLRNVGEFELSERPVAPSMIHEVAVVGEASERMKASLRSFGRYVPTDLVRDLLAQGHEARLDGAERPLTLFFSDVAGFTSSSEGMAPHDLVDALGEYLDVLTGAVKRHAGTIDKFIGDGVLAFFNAPRDDEAHVIHGCEAALAVQSALAAAQPEWDARGLPNFTTRIGLHTAEVVVGNIGTPDRFAYTVIGDGVNLAARLESLNKAYGTLILTSQEVRDIAGDAFVWRPIDRTAVVGRTAAGTVYELVGHAGAVDAQTLERCRTYERAFALYLGRNFEEAAEAFGTLASGDHPAAVLAARAEGYIQTPPPDDWTGVYVQTKK